MKRRLSFYMSHSWSHGDLADNLAWLLESAIPGVAHRLIMLPPADPVHREENLPRLGRVIAENMEDCSALLIAGACTTASAGGFTGKSKPPRGTSSPSNLSSRSCPGWTFPPARWSGTPPMPSSPGAPGRWPKPWAAFSETLLQSLIIYPYLLSLPSALRTFYI